MRAPSSIVVGEIFGEGHEAADGVECGAGDGEGGAEAEVEAAVEEARGEDAGGEVGGDAEGFHFEPRVWWVIPR
jgi:hypothetical protein